MINPFAPDVEERCEKSAQYLIEARDRLETFGIQATEAWMDETLSDEEKDELLFVALAVIVEKRELVFG